MGHPGCGDRVRVAAAAGDAAGVAAPGGGEGTGRSAWPVGWAGCGSGGAAAWVGRCGQAGGAGVDHGRDDDRVRSWLGRRHAGVRWGVGRVDGDRWAASGRIGAAAWFAEAAAWRQGRRDHRPVRRGRRRRLEPGRARRVRCGAAGRWSGGRWCRRGAWWCRVGAQAARSWRVWPVGSGVAGCGRRGVGAARCAGYRRCVGHAAWTGSGAGAHARAGGDVA